MKRWIIYAGVQAAWIAIHDHGETDAFWFGFGEVLLAAVLIIMLIVLWTDETGGKGV